MKSRIAHIVLTVLFFGISLLLTGQVDRTQPPEPGPAPRIELGAYQSFELKNGLRVIVVENHKLPVVTFRLYLDYDPVVEGDAAYVSMAGDLLRKGTENRSKQEIDEAIDFMGASLSTGPRGITASCLTKHMDELLELMTDVLYHPVFPEEELEKLKKQTISGLSTVEDNPQAMVGNVEKVLLYGKTHPYGEILTEEIVGNTTRDMCADFYSTFFRPDISYLVIVGDLKFKEAKKVARNYFGDWEPGDVPEYTYAVPERPGETRVAIIPRRGAVQSYVRVAYPVDLKPGSEDAIKARLMNQIFGGGMFSARLMQNLREDKAFTYGAYASLSTDPLSGSFNAGAQVRNSVTDSTVQEIFYEMERMRDELVSEEELRLVKNNVAGSFGRSLENPQTVANFALSTFRHGLAEDYYTTYLQKVEQVSREDIREMAGRYLSPEYSFVLISGNADEISGPMMRIDPEPEYYNHLGEPVEYGGTAETEGIDPMIVVNDYIEAIGGREKIEKIQDLTVIASGTVQGMTIDAVTRQMKPHYLYLEMSMNGSILQKQVFSGDSGYAEAMGQRQEIPAEQLEASKYEAQLFPQLHYDTEDYILKLDGTEEVEGEKAYVLKVTNPAGKERSYFFSMESGLLLQTTSVQQSQMGEITQVTLLKDYRPVEGVLYPFTTITKVGPQIIELKASKIEANKGLTEEDFR